MATTAANIITLIDSHYQDAGTVSITAAQRLEALNESLGTLYNEFDFDFMNRRYRFNYFDGVNRISLNTDAPDVKEPIGIFTRDDKDNVNPFRRGEPRELLEMISVGKAEDAFALEQVGETKYLLVNHASKYAAVSLHTMDDDTGNGTWAVDAINSDATNLTDDEVEYKQGGGSINFDVTVAQSGNNRGTIENSTLTAVDLSSHVNLSTLFFWFWLPESTSFTSVTPYWGSSSTVYWSAAITTDAFGDALVEGDWNLMSLAWTAATQTGTVDNAAIDYLRFDVNYGAGYGDTTDFRIDDVRMIRPERLDFKYITSYLAKSGATYQARLTATGNEPLFSDVYDQCQYYVVYKAVEIMYLMSGQFEQASIYEKKALVEAKKLRKMFPSTKIRPRRSFGVGGINWGAGGNTLDIKRR